jgi:ABC-2 type transport system ATP-binding protein
MIKSPVILTEGLTRRFDDITAVDDLNLEIYPGEVLGFLGHNGAGKTTTVRLLNGVLTPTSGKAQVLGLDPSVDGAELRQRTGVLTETPSVDERLTGYENLAIFAALFNVPSAAVESRVAELLEIFQLTDRAGDRVSEYSKGMKQKLALARAIIHQPELLFLDEPTSGLDPVITRQVHSLIRDLSRDGKHTVFLCTHNLEEAQRLCDRVAVLENGRMVALGSPSELARELWKGMRLEVETASRGHACGGQSPGGHSGCPRSRPARRTPCHLTLTEPARSGPGCRQPPGSSRCAHLPADAQRANFGRYLFCPA